ncbi:MULTISPECIES: protein kinase domain-containing protein [unclassified Streptomyces]|uniref:protein kinase domain-containing protein n=1 Tax=unclassified Streptomyces TaxID=2593676 RepID=UPI002DD8C427|nr:protein kinase [Streptomyces sp. NBC_00243]WRZ20285.1 protein kinase [Streptomyces sp. NBC_00243]
MSARSTHTVPVPKGYRVGAWEIREPIASGAFGSVYAAQCAEPSEGLPSEAALKFLPTGTSTPRQLHHLRELAERETELLRRLQRPRLVRMYETLTVDDPSEPLLDGTTVLVLERAEGSLGQLLDRLRDRRSGPPDHAVAVPGGPSLLAQICEGLAHLHHAGWVHGDLKPANVLLMADGSVRLADFNLASELEGTHAYSPAFSTPDYTPPELLWAEVGEHGHLTRPSADIWAFGILAHLVLTGSLPMPGATPAARREAAQRYARGEEELRLSPELPDAWREIVTDCLAPTHAARAPHTAQSLLRRVEIAAGAARSPRLPRLTPRRGPHPAVLGGLALVAVVSLVTAGLLALREPAPQGYARCDRGDVCFFTERDGQGEMCPWFDYEDNWLGGNITCDWAKDRNPKSAFNNGYDGDPHDDVQLFRTVNRKDPIGCIQANAKVNFPDRDGLFIRSHEWVGAC